MFLLFGFIGTLKKRFKVVVWAPKFDSYSDDVPIHLPREDPSYLTKFTLDLRSLSVREEKVIVIQSMAFLDMDNHDDGTFQQLNDILPPFKFLSVGVVERPSTSPHLSPRIVYLR